MVYLEKVKGLVNPKVLKLLEEQNVDIEPIVNEGGKLFQSIFGFESPSTVAPNVAWTNTTESIWNRCNIKFIQGGFLQEVLRFLWSNMQNKDLLDLKFP